MTGQLHMIRKKDSDAGRGAGSRRSEADAGVYSTGQPIDDSLPTLICLLDARACIVQVSLAAERWGMGARSVLPGVNLHELLHPWCAASSCRLGQMIADCAASADRAQECEARLSANTRQRSVDVAMWGLPRSEQLSETFGPAVAIVVVTDVTFLKSAHEDLRRPEPGA
jgi:hypothetical protein